MALLLVKLTLAPAFVVGASLVARRYGPLIGGLVGGLPVVAGGTQATGEQEQGDERGCQPDDPGRGDQE